MITPAPTMFSHFMSFEGNASVLQTSFHFPSWRTTHSCPRRTTQKGSPSRACGVRRPPPTHRHTVVSDGSLDLGSVTAKHHHGIPLLSSLFLEFIHYLRSS